VRTANLLLATVIMSKKKGRDFFLIIFPRVSYDGVPPPSFGAFAVLDYTVSSRLRHWEQQYKPAPALGPKMNKKNTGNIRHIHQVETHMSSNLFAP
jgi:hypothetical protein